MKLSDEFIQDILKKVPGSKKAAEGVLLPTEDGYFHLRGMTPKKETEGLSNEERFFSPFCSKKKRKVADTH
ncbi:hypothetical protein [Psychromonas arctica]|uniref:hypothetical protein n=1 Tax=Psychromonas arctica TaxID=168275 RepID=UPI002FD0B122